MTFVTFEEGERRQAERVRAAARYVGEHQNYQYILFLEGLTTFSFNRNHPQSENFPEVYTFFSIPSQHVRGDSLVECLDKAIRAAVGKDAPR